jgi:acetyltransferase
MTRMPASYELLLGLADDPTFGPVVLFGRGGTAAELVGDRAVALPPLNHSLARQLMARTRVYRLLQGYRDRPPVAIAAIALTLVRLSQMAVDLAEIVELDINPLVAGPTGVVAVDARAMIVPPGTSRPSARLSICPYPADLERQVTLPSGEKVAIRAIRPYDEPALAEMVARSTLEDVRLRFFHPLKEFPHELAARLSQIDYDREMALVALPLTAGGGGNEILGVARLAADPDNERAEYAVMVRSDQKGRGIGYQLMRDLLEHARRRKIGVVFGEVLRENQRMLQMVRELGFTVTSSADPGVVTVSIAL